MSAADFTDEELAAIRADFPILTRVGRGGGRIAYFDSSATSQKPAVVIDSVDEFYRQHNGAVHRGTHVLGDESTSLYEDARHVLADFIGGRDDEIVWTKNATEGINVVAYSMSNASAGRGGQEAQRLLAVGPGDRIVSTRAEHHANLVPWQELCQRSGAEFKWLDLTPDGRIDLDTLDVITPNTKLVAVTHVSNVTGAITPLEPILAAARNVGALILLDTCQSSAHFPINVKDLGVDFCVFSGHKMMGPTGVGALWAKRSILESMPPVLMGGSMIADVTMESTTYMDPPERFEAGSQPVAQIAGWAVALRYLKKLGMDRVAAHEATITEALLEGIRSVPGVTILGPTDCSDRIGVVSWSVDGVHPHDVGQVMDADDVAVRVGHHCALPLHYFFGQRASTRASSAVTNTVEEVELLVRSLEKVRGYFGKK